MKKFTFLIILLYGLNNKSFGQTDTLQIHEYVTLIAKPNTVSISYSNGLYEERKISSKGSDFTGILKIVIQFEKQGFELVTNDFQTYAGTESFYRNYFLMKKKKD